MEPRQYPALAQLIKGLHTMAKFGRSAKSRFGDEAQDIFGPESTDIHSAVDARGGGRAGRQRLAEELSGTTDRGSRTYKNAVDYISRHLRGSRRSVKSDKYGGVLINANREGRKKEIIESGTLNVTIDATIQVSNGRPWGGGLNKKGTRPLRGDEISEYLEEIEAGRYSKAIQIVAKAYGINESITVTKFRGISYS
jgi:hypothetical protein